MCLVLFDIISECGTTGLHGTTALKCMLLSGLLLRISSRTENEMQEMVLWVLHWQNGWMPAGSPYPFPMGCDESKRWFGSAVAKPLLHVEDEAKLEDVGGQAGRRR